MSIEEAIMGGIVFKGKKDKPKEEEKVKTKAKKATYIRGQHGSGAAKMKADIRRKSKFARISALPGSNNKARS